MYVKLDKNRITYDEYERAVRLFLRRYGVAPYTGRSNLATRVRIRIADLSVATELQLAKDYVSLQLGSFAPLGTEADTRPWLIVHAALRKNSDYYTGVASLDEWILPP